MFRTKSLLLNPSLTRSNSDARFWLNRLGNSVESFGSSEVTLVTYVDGNKGCFWRSSCESNVYFYKKMCWKIKRGNNCCRSGHTWNRL